MNRRTPFKSSSERGFVAIISTVLISSILTTLILSESMSVFWARFDQLAYENRTRALLLAESCLSRAVTLYIQDPLSITSGIPIGIDGTHACTLISSSFAQSELVVVVRASVQGVVVFLRGTASPCSSGTSLCLSSWKETTSTPP